MRRRRAWAVRSANNRTGVRDRPCSRRSSLHSPPGSSPMVATGAVGARRSASLVSDDAEHECTASVRLPSDAAETLNQLGLARAKLAPVRPRIVRFQAVSGGNSARLRPPVHAPNPEQHAENGSTKPKIRAPLKAPKIWPADFQDRYNRSSMRCPERVRPPPHPRPSGKSPSVAPAI